MPGYNPESPFDRTTATVVPLFHLQASYEKSFMREALPLIVNKPWGGGHRVNM
jgi:hypothetical protein